MDTYRFLPSLLLPSKISPPNPSTRPLPPPPPPQPPNRSVHMLGDQTMAGAGCFHDLPPDLLGNIHGRLSCVDRLAFAAVFRASRDVCKPESPWLVLPGETPEIVTLFSLADRRAAAVCASDPALRDHAVLGSSRGWLVTADDRAQMHLVNPVTGEQHALPAITTIPCLNALYGGSHFVFQLKPFVRGPPYADDRPPCGTFTLTADQMRGILYRKVVLSASPRAGSYAAMLILGPRFGGAAFATAEDAAWRLAPSRDGVEDAIHHKGQFYSITYSGAVEAWVHDTGAGTFTSTVVTSRLAISEGDLRCRKYLAAAPGGRLMAVLKDSKETTDEFRRVRWTCSFKVQVLDDDEAGWQWKEAGDIGDAALFVGANGSLCVSTREHPEIKAGCVYFTDDALRQAELLKDACNDCFTDDDDDKRGVGVFSLKDGTVEKIEALGQHPSWPPPAWFTPSIP